MHVAVVAAITREGGLGNAGTLPWHPRRLGLDMAFLQYISTNDYAVDYGTNSVVLINKSPGQPINTVVMGRKTWDSLPRRFRPLKNRNNLVVTRDLTFKADGADCYSNLEDAIASHYEGPRYILGGSGIYKEALEKGFTECAFMTELLEHPDMPCDVYFPLGSLSNFKKKVNVTKQAFESVKESLKFDEFHRLVDSVDPYFIDGDVTYRIMAYF
jgi:dihydrofolate reductase